MMFPKIWNPWRDDYNPIMNSTSVIIILLILIATEFTPISGDDHTHTLSRGQSISGRQTIVSEDGTFELGFFTKSNSRVYLGIWYKNFADRTVVWVANRDKPLLKASSDPTLEVSEDGNLVLLQDSTTFWSSDSISVVPNFVEAAILDTGNLVVRNGQSPSMVFWQSFDHPTDTWLPGGKLGFSELNHRSQPLVSWKNSEDPSPGLFSLMVDFDSPDQYFLKWNMTTLYWSSGLWTGRLFSFVPEISYTSNFSVINNKNETYFTYSLYNDAILSRFVIESSGELKQFTSLRSNLTWSTTFVQPRRQSEVYAFCGPFGVFNDSRGSNPCQCLQGFSSSSSGDAAMKLENWSDGCGRRTPLQCENRTSMERDGFWKIGNVKLPSNGMLYSARNGKDCESACFKNCSCSAYAFSENECSVWEGSLLGVKASDDETSKGDLHLKLAGTELPDDSGKKKIWVIITAVLVPLAVLISAGFLGFHCTKNKKQGSIHKSEDLLSYDFGYSGNASVEEIENVKEMKKGSRKEFDLPLFSYASVSAATNNFSAENKLGEGGFGPVYKGKSSKGQEIAVKRLSKRSGQGHEEFRNEILVIAKLQHRNLVRLLGCCIEQDEKILIYECMPNKSLDFFLFDQSKKEILEWNTRINIIKGIAQGLLYLHEYSRLRIIHRDLKASNILLDSEMNPKISDFGMARIFASDDSQANTKRIVGTYGYMAPEYALQGLFSIKSDVFSFGVLVLEIVSGKKNTGYFQSDHHLNLLGHAWDLWTCGRAPELMDPVLGAPPTNEVIKYINIGLLCVQEYPNDRPDMSTLVSVLSNDLTRLPKPQQPAFSTTRGVITSSSLDSAGNGLTMSMIEPR